MIQVLLLVLQEIVTQGAINIDWSKILGWIVGAGGILTLIIKGGVDRKNKQLASELTINEKRIDQDILLSKEKLQELEELQKEVKELKEIISNKEKIIQNLQIEAAVAKEVMANQDLGMKRLIEVIRKVVPEAAPILDSWK